MNIFVYGTLLVPEIWERVTGTPELASREASLPGHEIRRVRGAAYPAIFPSPAAVPPVPGRVFFEVPAAALRRLDAYEDEFYERVEVRAVADGLGPVAAQAYVIPGDRIPAILDDEGWTLEWFLEHGLAGFRSRVFGT